MSFTVIYRHPARPDEAGMALVADETKAAEKKDELVNRGFLVIEIVPVPLFARAHHQSD